MRIRGHVVIICSMLIPGACGEKEKKPLVFEGCKGKLEILTPYNHEGVSIYAPTAFTPNGDGLNDRFGLFGEGLSEVHLWVEANGSVVFEGTNPYESWDGKMNGTPYSGVFSYSGTVVTIHGEAVMLKGVANSLIQKDPDMVSNCAGCLFPDQISVDHGFIRPTQENNGCR